MTTLAIHSETRSLLKPEPRNGPITIRPAMLPPGGGADLMFIDQLQKKHSSAVGFMPTDQLQKNIAKGKVLIAQDAGGHTTARIGYCIFNDKYFKREDLGIVYQLNITPHMQRGLVGASLVKAAFEACPWGVKLFCCWCAQDLAANHFWESIGFVPIAFRAGSRGKEHGGKRKEGRMQIFWQRRIREGDEGPAGVGGGTPYWYPTETSGGSMKENLIVLPIPPGKHWSDELPFVLPGMERSAELKVLSAEGTTQSTQDSALSTQHSRKPRKAKPAAPAPPARPKRGLWFAAATSPPSAASTNSNHADAKPAEPAVKPKRERRRNDPKLVAAAREWRDRYLEQVNAGLILPEGAGGGKYDVSRQLEASGGTGFRPVRDSNGQDARSTIQVPLLNAA